MVMDVGASCDVLVWLVQSGQFVRYTTLPREVNVLNVQPKSGDEDHGNSAAPDSAAWLALTPPQLWPVHPRPSDCDGVSGTWQCVCVGACVYLCVWYCVVRCGGFQTVIRWLHAVIGV